MLLVIGYCSLSVDLATVYDRFYEYHRFIVVRVAAATDLLLKTVVFQITWQYVEFLGHVAIVQSELLTRVFAPLILCLTPQVM